MQFRIPGVIDLVLVSYFISSEFLHPFCCLLLLTNNDIYSMFTAKKISADYKKKTAGINLCADNKIFQDKNNYSIW